MKRARMNTIKYNTLYILYIIHYTHLTHCIFFTLKIIVIACALSLPYVIFMVGSSFNNCATIIEKKHNTQSNGKYFVRWMYTYIYKFIFWILFIASQSDFESPYSHTSLYYEKRKCLNCTWIRVSNQPFDNSHQFYHYVYNV